MWSENSTKPWKLPQPARHGVALMAVSFALALVMLMCALWELHLARSVRVTSSSTLQSVGTGR